MNQVTDDKNAILDLSDYGRPLVRDMASPFRYPGGKGFLTGYLASKLLVMGSAKKQYVEPFCGGAGAALHALQGDRGVQGAGR